MKRFRQAALISVLLAGMAAFVFVHAHADDKKKGQNYYLKLDQTLDLVSPKMVMAREKCENWGLAAGLETMLQKQNVPLDQSFWVMHLNYGEICIDRLPDMSHVAQVVNQEFVLDDGRHVRLELHFVAGAPTNVDAVLGALQQQQPTLLLWHDHFYYLTGATYDERIGRDGTRNFEIKELRLADTFASHPGATFQKGRDNLGEIGGIVSVSVVAK
jgi:hypothetical protein